MQTDTHYFFIYLLIAALAVGSVVVKKLTPLAGVTGAATGWVIFAGSGYTGVLLMSLFFVMGVAATSWKKSTKAQLFPEESSGGTRNAGQVLANAGIAAVASLLALVLPKDAHLFTLMIAGSFAAAVSDTISSELGNVYGSRYYHILTFKKGTRGNNGVVSLEGTLLGAAASGIMALLYCICTGDFFYFIPISAAGLLGNLADSILGATIEGKQGVGNNTVNFLNTATGAGLMLIIYL